MGALCSCCLEDGYADLNWIERSREISGATDRFRIRAASISPTEILVTWRKTGGRKLSHFAIRIAEAGNRNVEYYVEPPAGQTSVQFSQLKPGTTYEIKFCNREIYAWSEVLSVRTLKLENDGVERKSKRKLSNEPACEGLFVLRVESTKDVFIPSPKIKTYGTCGERISTKYLFDSSSKSSRHCAARSDGRGDGRRGGLSWKIPGSRRGSAISSCGSIKPSSFDDVCGMMEELQAEHTRLLEDDDTVKYT